MLAVIVRYLTLLLLALSAVSRADAQGGGTLLDQLAGRSFSASEVGGDRKHITLKVVRQSDGSPLVVIDEYGAPSYKFVRITADFQATGVGQITWDGEGKNKGRETKASRTVSSQSGFMVENVYFGSVTQIIGFIGSTGDLLVVTRWKEAKKNKPFDLRYFARMKEVPDGTEGPPAAKLQRTDADRVIGRPVNQVDQVLYSVTAASPTTTTPTISTATTVMTATPSVAIPSLSIVTAPRLALVIGNAAYGAAFGRLANPVNDANAVAAALRASGFTVTVVTDSDQRTMKRAIAAFGQQLRAAGRGATGLFYYAGHGVQSRGVNYLVPVNAAIEAEADVDIEAVAADGVLRQMEEAGAATSIVILDACRNLPIIRSSRDGSRGLARMEAPNGSFVAYSTAPGAIAADGSGANSPFASALVTEMTKPGQPIEVIFRNVRRAVMTATDGKQTPWDSSSLVDGFVFKP